MPLKLKFLKTPATALCHCSTLLFVHTNKSLFFFFWLTKARFLTSLFLDNSTSCLYAAMGKANFLRNVLFWSLADSISPPNGLAHLL